MVTFGRKYLFAVGADSVWAGMMAAAAATFDSFGEELSWAEAARKIERERETSISFVHFFSFVAGLRLCSNPCYDRQLFFLC